MISTSTNAPEHPEQAAAPPALPEVIQVGSFQPGMSGEEILGLIFQTCDANGSIGCANAFELCLFILKPT